MKKTLIIAVMLIMLLSTAACGKKDNEAGITTAASSSKEETTTTKEFSGKVSLTGTYNEGIYVYGSTFMVCDNNLVYFKRGDSIIDEKGNEVTILNAIEQDGYTLQQINSFTSVIKKNDEKIIEFGTDYDYTYENHVLYYTVSENFEYYVAAYDLVNKKELWRVLGNSPKLLENGYIKAEPDGGYKGYTIIRKNGEVIGASTEDTKYFAAGSDYYVKVTEDKLEMYDGTNKKSEISLADVENYSYEFVSLLTTNHVVISELNRETWDKTYKVYNKDMKLITELDDCGTYEGMFRGTVCTSDHVMISEAVKVPTNMGYDFPMDIIIFADDTVEMLYMTYFIDGEFGSLDAKTTTKKHFAIGYDDKYGVKIINLNNKMTKTVTDQSWLHARFAESENGKYVIVNYAEYDNDKNRIVLDENLEILYETENILQVINDKFVLEYATTDKTKMYLVNVFTKEKYELDTVGEYHTNNKVGLVTNNNGTYNLYSFE